MPCSEKRARLLLERDRAVVLPALQQGTIDGALVPVSVLTTLQYRDAATYATETGHSYVFTSASITGLDGCRRRAQRRHIAGRYLFFHSLASVQEIMLFLLVGTVFLGNAVVGFRGQQLRMDVVIQALPPGPRRASRGLSRRTRSPSA
jgi:Tripartite ATP-independent periplasmic transporters, DctQ component